MAWLILLVAGLLEIVWAIAMKHAEGFTRWWPSVITVVAAVASMVLLALAMRHLPVGTAYAVWGGGGAAGVAAAGITCLGESASPGRIACLLLVLAGVVGLRVVEGCAGRAGCRPELSAGEPYWGSSTSRRALLKKS